MKRVKDILSISSGVYGGIKSLYPTEYATMFGEMEPSDLDIELLSKCGSRFVSPVVYLCIEDLGEDTPTALARLICNRYLKNWLRVNDALTLDYDITQPVVTSYTMATEGTTNTAEERTGAKNSKVYGFGSDTPADENEDSTENNLSSSVDIDKTVTYTKKGIGSLTPNRLIEAEISLRRLSFINLTLNDIKDFCTLPIY